MLRGATMLNPARDGSDGEESQESQRGSACLPVTHRRIRVVHPAAANSSLTTSRPPSMSTTTLVAVLSDRAVISWATACSGSETGSGQVANTPSPTATCSGVTATGRSHDSDPASTAREACSSKKVLIVDAPL